MNDVRRETAGNFSDFFRQIPTTSSAFQEDHPGNHRKKSGKFSTKYCFHVPNISRVFLQDLVTFPHLSCKIRWQERSTWVLKDSRNTNDSRLTTLLKQEDIMDAFQLSDILVVDNIYTTYFINVVNRRYKRSSIVSSLFLFFSYF